MISEEILQRFGAEKKLIGKGEHLFRENGVARHYFQVAKGEIKMYGANADGREFIHGIFSDGDSFGEPPLLNGKPYLTSGVALSDSQIWILPKNDFLRMLRESAETALVVCARLADRLYYKSLMSMEISSEDPQHRLLRLFDFLKFDWAGSAAGNPYSIDLTRQQLADLTGLRVETVIRTVKSLERQGAVRIVGRKIFR